MGDEETVTKADFNALMTRMEAMMSTLDNHKAQLDALTSGTTSATPPSPGDPSNKKDASEEDPEKVDEGEGPKDTSRGNDFTKENTTKMHPPVSYVSGDTSK